MTTTNKTEYPLTLRGRRRAEALMASLTLRPGGTITVHRTDDNTVAVGYQDVDYWTALHIYVTPEQARTLAGELLEAAGAS